MPGTDFDERAATWDDDPTRLERARTVAQRILAAAPLSTDTRVLDYGAGTGLLSEGLKDHVGRLHLADPSAGMRQVAQAKVDAGVLPGAEVLALDLASDPVPDDLEVDAIVTMMALHHIPAVRTVLGGFAQLLDDGGTLVIIDLEREDGSFHDEEFDGHHGFDRSELSGWLEVAGFVRIRFDHAYTVDKDGRDYGLFLAVATRGGSGPTAA
ncbi:MAG: class I SAM-dependent methyltransferase [Nitriliruptoraceae bacterium]